jgi:hypothetical protein
MMNKFIESCNYKADIVRIQLPGAGINRNESDIE